MTTLAKPQESECTIAWRKMRFRWARAVDNEKRLARGGTSNQKVTYKFPNNKRGYSRYDAEGVLWMMIENKMDRHLFEEVSVAHYAYGDKTQWRVPLDVREGIIKENMGEEVLDEYLLLSGHLEYEQSYIRHKYRRWNFKHYPLKKDELSRLIRLWGDVQQPNNKDEDVRYSDIAGNKRERFTDYYDPNEETAETTWETPDFRELEKSWSTGSSDRNGHKKYDKRVDSDNWDRQENDKEYHKGEKISMRSA